MTSDAKTAEQYLKELPADRKEAMSKLREVVLKNLPTGFKETMGYGMLTYVVPHEIYPAGYHCDPKQALPFVSVASQKKLHCFLSHGYLCYAGPAEMVCSGISKIQFCKIRYGQELHTL